MIIRLSKDLYTKSVLLKSCFLFTDRAYIYIEQDSNNYIVNINSKSNEQIEEKEFLNALLAESLRATILDETKEIRKTIISRALASTIYENNDVLEIDKQDENNLLMDWFEKNE